MPISNDPSTTLTAYQAWQKSEGIPVIHGFYVEDLRTVEVQPWPRKGGRGAFINMEGTGGANDAYVCEIAPGEQLAPPRHLYEEGIYILKGRGAATAWAEGGSQGSVEWETGSPLAIPLHTSPQHL